MIKIHVTKQRTHNHSSEKLTLALKNEILKKKKKN